MVQSKYSPGERLVRKRLAARLRQQRCRARKRAQSSLPKDVTSEQDHANEYHAPRSGTDPRHALEPLRHHQNQKVAILSHVHAHHPLQPAARYAYPQPPSLALGHSYRRTDHAGTCGEPCVDQRDHFNECAPLHRMPHDSGRPSSRLHAYDQHFDPHCPHDLRLTFRSAHVSDVSRLSTTSTDPAVVYEFKDQTHRQMVPSRVVVMASSIAPSYNCYDYAPKPLCRSSPQTGYNHSYDDRQACYESSYYVPKDRKCMSIVNFPLAERRPSLRAYETAQQPQADIQGYIHTNFPAVVSRCSSRDESSTITSTSSQRSSPVKRPVIEMLAGHDSQFSCRNTNETPNEFSPTSPSQAHKKAKTMPSVRTAASAKTVLWCKEKAAIDAMLCLGKKNSTSFEEST